LLLKLHTSLAKKPTSILTALKYNIIVSFMNEQQVQRLQVNPQELHLGEPDTYVSDPVKAEVMAYASKAQEEAFIGHTSLAAIYANGVTGPADWRRIGLGIYQKEAGEARKDADIQAEIAGIAYDKGSV
jgi:hypothetical protein